MDVRIEAVYSFTCRPLLVSVMHTYEGVSSVLCIFCRFPVSLVIFITSPTCAHNGGIDVQKTKLRNISYKIYIITKTMTFF